jgi:hypothetical protein
MNSTTEGETWRVSGSNQATMGFVQLLTGDDELSHGQLLLSSAMVAAPCTAWL